MTHITGPRPKIVKFFKDRALTAVLTPKEGSNSERFAGLQAAEFDMAIRAFNKIEGDSCDTCPKGKRRTKAWRP